MSRTQQYLEELIHIETVGKATIKLTGEMQTARNNILEVYGPCFTAVKEFKKEMSDQCFHKSNQDKGLISWGLPFKADYEKLDRLNKGLSVVRDALNHCNEVIRLNDIRVKELRLEYQNLKTEMKEML